MSFGEGRDGKLRLAMGRSALSGKLAGLSLPRQILTIAAWPLLEQLLSFLCTSSSLFLAGHMDMPSAMREQVLSGLGVSSYILWLGFLVQAGVATGGTALVSRFYGARTFENAAKACNQAALLGLLAGFVAALLMFFSCRFLLTNVLDLSEVACNVAVEYLNIVSWMAIFSGFVFAVNASLRGAGDTKMPFLVMLLVNGVTITVSWVLVRYFDFGIPGLAYGILSSWAMAAAFLMLMMLRRRAVLRKLQGNVPLDEFCETKGISYAPPLCINHTLLIPDWAMIRRILAVGLPQSLEVAGIWIIQFYVLRLISSLGDAAVGAHTVAIRIESLSFLPGFAIGVAGSALVGQYLGSKNTRMALETIRRCTFYAMIFMGMMGVVFWWNAEFFARIFVSDSPAITNMTMGILTIFLFAEPFYAATITLRMCLRGAGDTKRVMYVSFLTMGFFRVFCLSIWYHFWPDTFSLKGIWILFTIDLFVQVVLLARLVKDLGWAKKSV